MSEKYFPFDSVKDSQGKGDRVYKSKSWSDYFKNFITSGLMHDNGEVGLNIINIENLQLTISPGGAFIEGKQYLLEEEKILQLETEPNRFRKDLIVLRMDDRINARYISIEIIKGEPTVLESDAIAPSMTRNENVYDLGLYTVLIRPQATSILASDIVDYRGNPDYCTLSNPKGFGGASIFIGEKEPNPQYVKAGDIWMPEINEY